MKTYLKVENVHWIMLKRFRPGWPTLIVTTGKYSCNHSQSSKYRENHLTEVKKHMKKVFAVEKKMFVKVV